MYLAGLVPDGRVAPLRHWAHFREWPLAESARHLVCLGSAKVDPPSVRMCETQVKTTGWLRQVS